MGSDKPGILAIALRGIIDARVNALPTAGLGGVAGDTNIMPRRGGSRQWFSRGRSEFQPGEIIAIHRNLRGDTKMIEGAEQHQFTTVCGS